MGGKDWLIPILMEAIHYTSLLSAQAASSCCPIFCAIMYPCSTKTREVLGNPSPKPKRFPETREISRGRSPREISRVEGNLEGRGKSRGRRGWISQYLPSFGGARTISQHQFFYREWIRKSFPVDREGLTVLKSILPC